MPTLELVTRRPFGAGTAEAAAQVVAGLAGVHPQLTGVLTLCPSEKTAAWLEALTTASPYLPAAAMPGSAFTGSTGAGDAIGSVVLVIDDEAWPAMSVADRRYLIEQARQAGAVVAVTLPAEQIAVGDLHAADVTVHLAQIAAPARG